MRSTAVLLSALASLVAVSTAAPTYDGTSTSLGTTFGTPQVYQAKRGLSLVDIDSVVTLFPGYFTQTAPGVYTDPTGNLLNVDLLVNLLSWYFTYCNDAEYCSIASGHIFDLELFVNIINLRYFPNENGEFTDIFGNILRAEIFATIINGHYTYLSDGLFRDEVSGLIVGIDVVLALLHGPPAGCCPTFCNPSSTLIDINVILAILQQHYVQNAAGEWCDRITGIVLDSSILIDILKGVFIEGPDGVCRDSSGNVLFLTDAAVSILLSLTAIA